MSLDNSGLVLRSTMQDIAAAIRERTAAGGGAAGSSEWTGTRAAYEAMASHDANTWYFIKKEAT